TALLADLSGALGYAPVSAEAQLRLMGHLSRWLGARGLAPTDLVAEVLGRFVAERRESYSHLRSARALVPLLGYLRGRGAVPLDPVASPAGMVEVLEGRFAGYLLTERGLAPATIRSYRDQVRPFLAAQADRGEPWPSLTAGRVDAFITERALGQRPRSVAVGLNALRAFLRWMWLEGMICAPLAETIGSTAAPTGTALPRALSPGQVRDLLAALPDDGPARLRNEAMLALMWRLGLRAGEVAALRLEDIDWTAGTMVVRGKGDRRDQVPLPVDVGELVVAYLQQGRPPGTEARHVFLGLDAPHRPLTSPAVSSVTSRALARAGVTGPGAAHRLRHTAACQVLADGGGLLEAGQLLRHATVAATAIYAKDPRCFNLGFWLMSCPARAMAWVGRPGR
ncbi:tyrosine-type recombinase/integrase, partial [Specibacter cremeus]|uniref:tyrosine-type recombinase/integrase n=1 Tax=Specibacter cremeus TaxID=1629051 RepID=UPI000F7A76BB